MTFGMRNANRWLLTAAVCTLLPTTALSQETKPAKSLYERLGGGAAIKAVVDDFVATAAGDPAVNFARKGTAREWQATDANVARFKKRLVQFLSVAFGAKGVKYEGKDMKTVHRGMGISEAEFNALAGHLEAALRKHNVPQAEMDEVMKIAASTAPDIVETK
jgi:hemoglobin